MPERILVLGAGAIGSYIGGSLAVSGEEVVFFDRPEMKRRIEESGITISQVDQFLSRVEYPTIISDFKKVENASPFDFALMAVKSYDTQNLLQQMAPYKKFIPPIVCLQNGVENEASIQEVLGRDHVIAASVTTAIGKSEDNTIVVERLRGIGLSSTSPLSEKIQVAFNRAGLNCQLYNDAWAMKWSKMVTNLTSNALSAILDMPPGEILRNKDLFRIEMGQIREALDVMAAYQIPVVDLPKTPVRLLAFAAKNLPLFISQPLLVNFIAKGRGEKMPSFYIDLQSGRGKSEVNYLNGAVVRFGESKNIATPINRYLTEVLMGITTGAIKHEEFRHKPEKIIAHF